MLSPFLRPVAQDRKDQFLLAQTVRALDLEGRAISSSWLT
jgi:hypothetical protein